MKHLQEQTSLGAGRAFRVLRWSENLSRVEVVERCDRAVPYVGQGAHWHYHRASELTIILRGTGTRFVADNIELFEAGDVVLLGSNVPHYWHVQGGSRGLAIQWHFPLEHGIWSFAEAAALKRLEEYARRGLHIRGATAQAIQQRMQQLVQASGLAQLSLLIDIFGRITDAASADIRPLAARPFSLSGSEHHQEAMSRAVSYILAHYRETIHLADLLQLVSMSRATFAREFSRHAGKSFSTFLNQVRLQAVCHNLHDTSSHIGSIALDHGFNNLSFFNRLFRREFGITPTAYRQGKRVLDSESAHETKR